MLFVGSDSGGITVDNPSEDVVAGSELVSEDGSGDGGNECCGGDGDISFKVVAETPTPSEGGGGEEEEEEIAWGDGEEGEEDEIAGKDVEDEGIVLGNVVVPVDPLIGP